MHGGNPLSSVEIRSTSLNSSAYITAYPLAPATPADPPSSAAPPAPAATPDTKALFQDLFTAPSALDRYKRLLVDPSTGGLLSGAALRANIVFDYNNGATLGPGDKGGKITAAVAETFPILVDQD